MLVVSVVKYPRHRQYDEQRVAANNAVMALVAGSKLATSVLSLTEGSEHRLAELFPSVKHVDRLNLRTEQACEILSLAEEHVGGLAIPYILSIHEDYLSGCCELMVTHGGAAASILNNLSPANMHERLATSASGSYTGDTLILFHFLRLLRNAQIHNGGRAHNPLINFLPSLVGSPSATWRQITGNPMATYSLDTPLQLTIFELIGTLAISKRLAEEANGLLQIGLPRSAWLRIAVDDWVQQRRKGNSAQWVRNCVGYARTLYSPLGLTATEIEGEMRSSGLI